MAYKTWICNRLSKISAVLDKSKVPISWLVRKFFYYYFNNLEGVLDIWPVSSQACNAHLEKEQSTYAYHCARNTSHKGFLSALSLHLQPPAQR